MNPLLVIEQHGRKPPVLVVPHKDDDLVLGDGFLIVGCQHHPLEVEQNDGSLLLESLVEHKTEEVDLLEVEVWVLGQGSADELRSVHFFLRLFFRHARLPAASSLS